MNSFAQAWIDAENDLNIKVIHPFKFETQNGDIVETVGIYLPDFGSKNGTLLTCRFDSDEVMDLGDDSNYYSSALSPYHYEPYKREVYIETLNDWGWFSSPNEAPKWFKGSFNKHGGA